MLGVAGEHQGQCGWSGGRDREAVTGRGWRPDHRVLWAIDTALNIFLSVMACL